MATIITSPDTAGTVNVGTLDSSTLDATGQPAGMVPATDGADGWALTTPAGSGDMTKATYDPNDDGKVASADSADAVPWAGITGTPATFPPSSHSHTVAEVTDAGALASLDAVTAGLIDSTGAGAGDVPTADGVGGTTWAPVASGSITYATATATADTSLAVANNWYSATGVSLALGAGTWLVLGRAIVGRTSTGATRYTVRVWDSTNFVALAEAEQSHPSSNPHWVTVPVDIVVVLVAPATLVLHATANSVGSGSAISANAKTNSTSPLGTGTLLTAVKLAP